MSSSTVLSPKVLTLVKDVELIRIGNVCGLALVVYDIFLTFPREVELIWKRRISIPAVLYLANRYIPLPEQIFTVYGMLGPATHPRDMYDCASFYALFSSLRSFEGTAWIYYQLWMNTLQVAFMEIVMVYRVHALYRSKKVLALMATAFILSFTAIALVISFAVGRTISISEPLPGIHFCIPDPNQHRKNPGITWAFWVATMTFETIVFSLAAIKLCQNLKIFGTQVLKPSTGGLISIILRDAIWYYVFVVMVDMINLILNLTDHALSQFAVGLTASSFSIVATRLLLNLREVNARQTLGDSTLSALGRTQEAIEFAVRNIPTVPSDATAWTNEQIETKETTENTNQSRTLV